MANSLFLNEGAKNGLFILYHPEDDSFATRRIEHLLLEREDEPHAAYFGILQASELLSQHESPTSLPVSSFPAASMLLRKPCMWYF